jgi:hypothetical protein
MTDKTKDFSSARTAQQSRARRTKLIVFVNLSLTAVLALVAVGIWGHNHGWFATESKRTAADKADGKPAGSAQPDADDADPAAATPAEATAPRAPRKWAVVCGVTDDTRVRMGDFLRSFLATLGKRNTMDVMASTSGQFTSLTGGFVPVTPEAALNAADLVEHAGSQPNVSAMAALEKAGDERADAVYLLLTTEGARQLGPDPAIAILKSTHGRKMVVNCIWFMTDREAPGDSPLKALADATGGGNITKRPGRQ